MWQHQIIRDLNVFNANAGLWLPYISTNKLQGLCNTLVSFIETSKTFYIEINNEPTNNLLYDMDLIKYYKMPYNKITLLVKGINKHSPIGYDKLCYLIGSEKQNMTVFVLKSLSGHWSLCQTYFKTRYNIGQYENIEYYVDIKPIVSIEINDAIRGGVYDDIMFIRYFQLMVNCKNIQIKTCSNIKMSPGGKQKRKDLYSYHVLKIKQNSPRYENDSTPTGIHNRVHFCRGHFKNYTAENPLLGKHTGLYWWQPHMRGQDNSGFVDKDYLVEGDQQ